MESIAGQSRGITLVRKQSQDASLDVQGSESRTLKRKSDFASGRDGEAAHDHASQRCHSQSQQVASSVALPERSGDLATQEGPTDQNHEFTYSASAPDRNSEDTSHVSSTALQALPTSVEHGVDLDQAEEAYTLPLQIGETWAAPNVTSFGEMNMEMLPDHVLSPSISSSHNLEDGIFEPGSAYQNLFQSLRSHVFRTAQTENDPSAKPQAPAYGLGFIPASHSGTSGDRSTAITQGTARNGNAKNVREFELPPAQEYLLWKAWTEEVSVWVCEAFRSLAITKADEHLA